MKSPGAAQALLSRLFAFVSLAALTGASGAADPPGTANGPGVPGVPGIHLLSSDAAGTRLVIIAGEPRFKADSPIDAKRIDAKKEDEPRPARVAIEGFASLSPPGAPDLPGRTVLIAIPAGAKVGIEVVVEEEQAFPGIRVAPVPSPGPRPEPGAPPSWIVSEAPAFYATPYPAERVSVSPVQQIGTIDVVAVTARPAIYDPEARQVRVARRMVVSVVTAGGQVRAAGEKVQGGGPTPFALGQVVNPEAAQRFAHARQAPAFAPTLAEPSFESSTNWVKVFVAARGLVRLDGARLASAGVNLATIDDPATLRLFWGGGLDPESGVSPRSPAAPTFMEECAIEIQDGGDGSFDSGDAVLFLGQGASGWLDDFRGGAYALEYREHRKVDRGVYWLTWGGVFPGPLPKRIGTRAAPPQGDPVVERGLARIHSERNQRYNADLYEVGHKWEHWWWAQLRAEDSMVQFPVAPVKPDLSQLASLRLRLWGNTAAGVPPRFDHYARVWFNSVPILDPADGDSVFAWDGPMDPGTGRSGRKDVVSDSLTLLAVGNRIEVDIIQQIMPGQLDDVMMAWFDLGYVRQLDLTGEVGGEVLPTGADGPVTVEVTGAPAGARVFDVTDPRSPVELTGFELAGGLLRFAAELDSAAQRKFMVGVPPVAPARVEVDTPQPSLRNVNHGAWYVVIAHDSMFQEAVRLAQAHAQVPPPEGPLAGMPLVVRLSDVYDEFGWGLKSEVAIRNFIDYTVHAWAVGPSYVCLLGDATYDAKDVFGGGRRDLDLLPVPQFWNWIGGTYLGSDYLSDDFYCRTFGTALESAPDRFIDVAIGRLPASDAEEARVMVDGKTVPYLTSSEYGPWRQRVILAADDEIAGGPGGSEWYHTFNSENASAFLPPELERAKIYMIEFPREPGGAKPAARAAFIEAFNQGAAIVNYIGHGAPDVLAHEALFRVENVGQLLNGRRLPFFSTFSCSVNRFDQPSFEGIGEALVAHPGGGSVVSVGATDLAFVGQNAQLNNDSYGGFFIDKDFTRPVTFGVATVQAVNHLAGFGDTASAFKYIYLGDPALPPATPDHRMPIQFPGAAGVDTTRLIAGIRYELKAAPLGAPAGSWTGLVQARDSENLIRVGPFNPPYFFPKAASAFFRSNLEVTGDTLATQLIVPVDASQSLTAGRGLGEVRIYGVGSGWDGLGVESVYLDVENASPGEPEPVDVPRIEAAFAGDARGVPPDAMLQIRIEDKSGINIVGNTPANFVFMRIDESRTVVLNDLFEYEPGSATRGSVSFRLPGLAEGPHFARIFASDNYLNRGEAEVPFTVVVAGGLTIANVGLYPNPLVRGNLGGVFSFELSEPAEVTLRIYAVSGKLVRSGFHELRDQLGGGVHQIHWDGRDEDGDLVANGVYLCAIAARGLLSGDQSDSVIRALVNR